MSRNRKEQLTQKTTVIYVAAEKKIIFSELYEHNILRFCATDSTLITCPTHVECVVCTEVVILCFQILECSLKKHFWKASIQGRKMIKRTKSNGETAFRGRWC